MTGVDISDPSKLSKEEWTLVCSLPIWEFTKQQRPMITKCSAKFAKFLTASDTSCVKTTRRPGTANTKDQTISPEKIDAAVCQAVQTLVRVYVFANCCAKRCVAIDAAETSFKLASRRHGLLHSQEKVLTLGDVDISNPSDIPQTQWQAICSQLKTFNSDQQKMVTKCSEKMSKLFEAARTKCPQGGSGGGSDSSNDPCKNFEQVVRWHIHVA